MSATPQLISPVSGEVFVERAVASLGGALSVIGDQALTRPKSCHLRKA
jgi:hypothetical protein